MMKIISMLTVWTFLLLFTLSPLQAESKQAKADALKDLQEGKKLLKQGKVIKAEKHFKSTIKVLNGRDRFSRDMKKRVAELIKISEKKRQEHLKAVRIAQLKQAAKLAYQDEDRRKKMLTLRKKALEGKLDMLLRSKDYSRAENLAKEILRIDPDNKSVKQKVTFAQSQATKAKARSLASNKAQGRVATKNYNAENYIIQTKTLTFDKDFKKRTDKRKAAQEESKSQKEESWRTNLRAKMTKGVKYDFEGVPLSEVLKKLEIAHEVTIIVDTEAWSELLGDGEVIIDLKSSRMTLDTALYWIFQPFDLQVGMKYGTLYIAPGEKQDKKKFVKAYDVRDLVLVIKDYKAAQISLGADGGEGIIIEEEDPRYEGLEVDSIVEYLEKILGDLSSDS